MLADKFWLNPDSKMIWVAENHIKTIVENPVLFEYDGKEELDNILKYLSGVKFSYIVLHFNNLVYILTFQPQRSKC